MSNEQKKSNKRIPWFVSDTHWSHEKLCSVFKRPNGRFVRPFANADEMDRIMIENWNRVVQDDDVVINLGDVAIKHAALKIHYQLKGTKRLQMGNHDISDAKDFLKHFETILGPIKVDDSFGNSYIISHMPIHQDCLAPWCKANIHGHLHINVVNDPRYISMCMEQIDYTPFHLDEVHKRVDLNHRVFKKTGHVINFSDEEMVMKYKGF